MYQWYIECESKSKRTIATIPSWSSVVNVAISRSNRTRYWKQNYKDKTEPGPDVSRLAQWPLADMNECNISYVISNRSQWSIFNRLLAKLRSGKCHNISLVKSEHGSSNGLVPSNTKSSFTKSVPSSTPCCVTKGQWVKAQTISHTSHTWSNYSISVVKVVRENRETSMIRRMALYRTGISCFVVFCWRYVSTDLPITFRVTSLATW